MTYAAQGSRLLFATAPRMEAVESVITDRKVKRARVTGLVGSAHAMFLAGLRKRKSPYLVIADDPEAAGYLYNDLCQIAGPENVAVFPSGYRRDIKYGQPDPPSQILRTEALDSWGRPDHPRWVVASPEALAERVPRADDLGNRTLDLARGQVIAMTDVAARLREFGFSETDYVYEPGQFARRGSIVDVYSYSNELPYRVDFFDDEIDSIRTFNVETQLSERKMEKVSILPPVSEAGGSS